MAMISPTAPCKTAPLSWLCLVGHRYFITLLMWVVPGFFTTLGLFALPAFLVISLENADNMDVFNPCMIQAGMLNTAAWVLYGSAGVAKSSLTMILYGFGLMAYIVYNGVFLYYANGPARKKAMVVYAIEVWLTAAVTCATFLSYDDPQARVMFVGIYCDFCGLILYASYIPDMYQALSSNNIDHFPLFSSIAGFFNSSVWLAYSIMLPDVYLCVSNGFGVIISCISLFIYVICPFRNTQN